MMQEGDGVWGGLGCNEVVWLVGLGKTGKGGGVMFTWKMGVWSRPLKSSSI